MNSNHPHPLSGEDIFQAINRGGHAMEILDALPTEHKQLLAKGAGVPIQAKMKRIDQALKAAYPRIITLEKKYKYSGMLSFWLSGAAPKEATCLQNENWGWQEALFVLLIASEGCPIDLPDSMKEVLISVVEGDLQKIEKMAQNRIRMWLSCAVALQTLNRSERANKDFVRSVKLAWESEQTDDEKKRWFIVSNIIASDVERYRNECLVMIDTIKECLSCHATLSDASFKVPKDDDQILEHLHDSKFFKEIKAYFSESTGPIISEIDNERIKFLLKLASRLRPEPPARDIEELQRETAALFEAYSKEVCVDLEKVCPTLETLGRVFLDDEEVDESLLEKLDLLSRKFSRMLEQKEFSLAPEGAAEVTPEKLPNKANDEAQEETKNNTEVDAKEPVGKGAPEGSAHAPESIKDNNESPADNIETGSRKENEVDVAHAGSDGILSSDKTSLDSINTSKENTVDESSPLLMEPHQSGCPVSTTIQDHRMPPQESGESGDATFDKVATEDKAAEWREERPIGTKTLNHFSSKKFAEEIVLGSSDHSSDDANILTSLLLYEGEYDWFHLLNDSQGGGAFTPWVSEILELGTQYQPGFTRSEERLEELFQELEDVDKAGAMAILAGAIRPSLMIPHVYPQAALDYAAEQLGSIPGFKSFIDALKDFATRRDPLSEEYLRGLDSMSSFEKDKEEHTTQLKLWIKSAHQRKNKYQAATRTWGHLAGPKGDLSSLVVSVLDDKNHNTVRDQLAKWRDSNFIDKLINKACKEALGDKQKKKIKYGARERLESDINHALDLVEDHLEFQKRDKAYREGDHDFIRSSFRVLQRSAEDVLDHVESFTKNQNSYPLMAAANALLFSVKEVATTFEDVHSKKGKLDPILQRQILRICIPQWEDPEFSRISSGNTDKAIIEYIANPLTELDSFNKHLNAGNLTCAKQLKEFIIKKSNSNGDDLSGKFDDKRDEWARKADAAVDLLNNMLQDYLLRGIISEEIHLSYSTRCNAMKRTIENDPLKSLSVCTEVDDSIKHLEDVKEATCKEHQAKIERTLKRIVAKEIETSRDLQKELQRHLDNGAIGLIRTYLDVLEKGLSDGYIDQSELPSETNRRKLFTEFSTFANDIANASKNLGQLAKGVSKGTLDCLPQLAAFDKDSLRQRGEILAGWDSLIKRPGGELGQRTRPYIFSLLRWLGFTVEVTEDLHHRSSHGRPNHWKHYFVKADIDGSPTPRFGSKAQAGHHIVFVWKQLEPADLAAWLKKIIKDKNAPVWVLHFNSLTLEERWQMVVECRKHGQSPMLIDTTLLTWLCGFEPGERIKALFHVGMTGAHDNPYTPDSGGAVPKEMFYGRQEDIQRLWDPEGPCILYGGRQLGKSALLRRVEREYHAPDKQNYVFYAGVQLDDKIWDIFSRTLISAGILKSKGKLKAATIKENIRKMLDENPGMRILFLLDECDMLLNEDSQNQFKQLILLRDLMTQTERRFKAVFTGLHNVQRYERMPNQPLAHFGAPLRIGPLAPGDAEKLVQEPLSLLGYDMEQQVVHQVLAQTNYHPSLIQLFCHELVSSMQTAIRNRKTLPPIKIDNAIVSQVWRRTDLSQRMKDRFDWTLNLDKRYRVIGYIVAMLELCSDDIKGRQTGFDIFTIMDEVKDAWPQGLSGLSHDELAGLLDEMEGLGVIARQGRSHYRLKNSNVISLLGGEKGIEDEIDRFNFMEPDEDPTPEVIHRLIHADTGKASPLSLKQEGAIVNAKCGVHCIMGSKALGLDEVLPALESFIGMADDRDLRIYNQGTSRNALSWVKSEYTSNPQKETISFFIDMTRQPAEQAADCIKNLTHWINNLRSEKRVARIIAILDPTLLISFVINHKLSHLEDTDGIQFHFMNKWKRLGLNHWFHDADIPGTTALNEWMKKSGGWHLLLTKLQQGRKAASGDLSAEKALEREKGALIGYSGLSDNSEVESLFGRLVDLVDEPTPYEDIFDLFRDDFVETRLRDLIKIMLLLGILVEEEEGLLPDPIVANAYKRLHGKYVSSS